jgi:hypothetical protein
VSLGEGDGGRGWVRIRSWRLCSHAVGGYVAKVPEESRLLAMAVDSGVLSVCFRSLKT